MKVWDLMAKLAECTAGADVCVSTLVTVKQLQNGGEFDKNEEGRSVYNVSGAVAEVSDDGSLVTLIADY